MGLSQFDEKYGYTDLEQIDHAWGTAKGQFIGGADPPTRADRMILTSTDTVDRSFEVWNFYSAAQNNLLGTVNVPAGAGSDPAIPPVDAIAVLFPDGNGYVCSGRYGLGGGPTVAVTAGTFIYCSTLGGYV
jgi:hypothetical protein